MAYRKKRTTKRRFAKKRSMKRSVKRPALKKMIRREISRNIESKTVQHYDYDQRLYGVNNVSFQTDNIFPLGPDPGSLIVTQGVTQSQRIGNVVKTKKLMFKGTFVPLPYDGTFNPQPQPVQLTMWIFYDKTNPVAVPTPTASNDFFQNGAASKGFQNDLTDNWSPVNTDRYRVLLRRNFKLGFAQFAGSGASVTNQNFANNDFKLNCNFSINLTKYYPKMVKFNDGTTTPTTRGLFCMVTYALANGGQVPPAAYMVGMQWMQNYVFEDA